MGSVQSLGVHAFNSNWISVEFQASWGCRVRHCLKENKMKYTLYLVDLNTYVPEIKLSVVSNNRNTSSCSVGDGTQALFCAREMLYYYT